MELAVGCEPVTAHAELLVNGLVTSVGYINTYEYMIAPAWACSVGPVESSWPGTAELELAVGCEPVTAHAVLHVKGHVFSVCHVHRADQTSGRKTIHCIKQEDRAPDSPGEHSKRTEPQTPLVSTARGQSPRLPWCAQREGTDSYSERAETLTPLVRTVRGQSPRLRWSAQREGRAPDSAGAHSERAEPQTPLERTARGQSPRLRWSAQREGRAPDSAGAHSERAEPQTPLERTARGQSPRLRWSAQREGRAPDSAGAHSERAEPQTPLVSTARGQSPRLPWWAQREGTDSYSERAETLTPLVRTARGQSHRLPWCAQTPTVRGQRPRTTLVRTARGQSPRLPCERTEPQTPLERTARGQSPRLRWSAQREGRAPDSAGAHSERAEPQTPLVRAEVLWADQPPLLVRTGPSANKLATCNLVLKQRVPKSLLELWQLARVEIEPVPKEKFRNL
ncbi:hypothetical protein NDU88_000936 [Pleurodeles waltl]|uniref:Uncharacterized protein n=1 Tax=Pleurodeles waltl TaxID=8319 RepID=A0AAV7R7J5_PLEWA|nr:hypothetical protein NDU88_000936 [Pleurodeles waltl]